MSELAVPGETAAVVEPAMPVIRPAEQSAEPYPVCDGISPTLGWQWRAAKKGGPVFAVITRSLLGTCKAQQAFPLNEAGWAAAWQALAAQSPANAAVVAEAIRARQRQDRIEQARAGLSPEMADLDERTAYRVRGAKLLGGYGPDEVTVGRAYDVRFMDGLFVVCEAGLPDVRARIGYGDIEVVDIGGPGLVRTVRSFVGTELPGFGFAGFGVFQGMGIPTVLSALTTETTITTVIRVQATDTELFFLHTRLTPQQLRIALSRPLGEIRAIRAAEVAPHVGEPPAPASPVEELTRLVSMLEGGLLTREEFDTLKGRLLSPE